jgi:hypothetical protein
MLEPPDRLDAVDASRPPIDDYDHMTVRQVESHADRLGQAELEGLVRYETAHQDRAPVVRILTARLRRLREAAGAGGRTVRGGLAGPGGGYGPAPETSRPGRSVPGVSGTAVPNASPPRLPDESDSDPQGPGKRP